LPSSPASPYSPLPLQPPLAPVADPTDRTDPLVPTGIVMAVPTAAFAVAGTALLAVADGPHDGRNASGASLLGAAIGMGVVGIPTLIRGLSEDAPPPEKRASESKMVTGLALSGMGSSMVGAGIGFLASGDDHAPSFAIPLLITGGVHLAIGLPL